MSTGKKTGRPLKYNPKFHPESFVALSKQGKNITEIACEWDVARETVWDWGKKYSIFSNALKRGKEQLENWWINFGKEIAAGQVKNANVTAYIWLTKNCINWSDKVENKNLNSNLDWDIEDED